MWRIAWLLLVVAALAISAFTALPAPITESVQGEPLQLTATRRPTRTPRVTPTRTRRATPTRRATATRRPTATPDPRIWSGLTGYQDVGVPLPKSARTFGGGVYVPRGAVEDSQTANFTDEVRLGVGAYYPNEYDGEDPVLLPDETGVERVEFTIYGPDGSTVYQATENNKPFCLFGDASGRCTPFNFENNECQWPDNNGIAASPILEGFHQLEVSLFATDGNAETWFVSLILSVSADSPCATPLEIFSNQYDIAGCCNDAGQRNDEVLSASVEVFTSEYLGAEVLLRGDACSDVAFRVYVDDDFIKKTEFVGPLAGGWDGSNYMTGYIELGDYDPGTHTIRISPEGREGGCNNGGLGNWEGMVNVYYSE